MILEAAVESLCRTFGVHNKSSATIAIVFALVSFVLHYGIERKLDSAAVFDQYNVMFQADPNERIGAMSHGWGRSGRNIAHPNLSNFTSPFVRVIAAVAERTGITDDAESFRRSIGMLIVPITAAITTAALLGLFIRMGFTLLLASLFATIHLVSFSPVIFGSMPDHFALSALVITLAFHLFLITTTEQKPHWAAWALVLFLATGITITNIVIIAIVMFLALWGLCTKRKGTLLRGAAMVVIVLIATMGTSIAMNKVLRGKQLDAQKTTNWATHFIDKDTVVRKAFRFPLAIANTVAPARITLGPPTASFRPDDRYQFLLTFETHSNRSSAGTIPGLITIALVILGLALSLRRQSKHAALGLAAAAVLGFNWIFHSVWGDEMFLYSQHWFTSLLILMAVTASHEKWQARSPWVIGVYSVAITINSIVLLRAVFDLLSSTPA